MKDSVVFIATMALMIGGSVACSSGHPSAKPKPGTLRSGTAHLSIDGENVLTVQAVRCAPPEEYSTTITTGDDASGATAMVDNAGKLAVEFVRIRNVGGFTGAYNRGLEGDATVTMTENTYDISGIAFGYSTKSPEPTTEPFTIMVSC